MLGENRLKLVFHSRLRRSEKLYADYLDPYLAHLVETSALALACRPVFHRVRLALPALHYLAGSFHNGRSDRWLFLLMGHGAHPDIFPHRGYSRLSRYTQ